MSKEMICLYGAPASSVLALISSVNDFRMGVALFGGVALVLCAAQVCMWMVDAISKRVVDGVMARLEAYEAASSSASRIVEAPASDDTAEAPDHVAV